MLDRDVKIPKNLEKVVALNAGTLRLISWLDATTCISAVEGNEKQRHVPYLYANPALREKPVIGTGNNYEPELLTALAPDAIFSTYITASEADKLQQRTGIPVLAVQYGNFDDEIDTVYSALRFLGKLLHRQERADSVISFIQSTIGDLKSRTESIPPAQRPKVYVGGIAYRGSHGITSTEPRYPSFRFVNAENVARSLGAVMTSPRDVMLNAFIDKEQLIEWNPEYIFVDMGSLFSLESDMLAEPWLETLRAFRQGKVYSVFPYNWYTTNYSTILVNSYFIGKILYPKAFADVDPEKKADEIYGFMLGAPIYEMMVKRYGACRNLTETRQDE